MQRRCPPSKWHRATGGWHAVRERSCGLRIESRPDSLLEAFARRAGCGVDPGRRHEAVVGAALDVPAFALVTWPGDLHVVVMGAVDVETDAPSLPLLSGATSRTWVEHGVAGTEPVEVVAGDATCRRHRRRRRRRTGGRVPPDGHTRPRVAAPVPRCGRAGRRRSQPEPDRRRHRSRRPSAAIGAARPRHRWRLDGGQHRPRRTRSAPRRGRRRGTRGRRARTDLPGGHGHGPRPHVPLRPSQPADERHLPAVRGPHRSRRAARRGGPADPGAARRATTA